MRMSTSKKGFDPLSSLFDVPVPGPVLPEVDDPPTPMDDAAELPEPSHVKKPRATPIVPPVPLGPAPSGGAVPPAPPASGPDPAMLARLIGRAAQAKAGAPKPSSNPLSSALPPPGVAAGAVPTAAPAGAPDPAEIARAVARAALAKAGAPKPAPARADSAPKARTPEPAKPAAGASRLFAAPPPKKSLSVDEAMAAARADEEKSKAEKAKPAAPPASARPASPPPLAPVAAATVAVATNETLEDIVSAIMHAGVPGLGAVYVANALRMDDRGLLTTLWKAHRARFASIGEIERAVACGAVIRAVGSVAIGQLVAAHAVTDKTDYLIWVDLITRQPVAAFADARAWFASESN